MEKRVIKRKLAGMIRDNKIVLILAVLIVGMTIASDDFLTATNIINVTRQISTSAMIGLGFTMVVASGAMDLSVGTMLGLIGVIMARMSLIEGMPIGVVFLVGIICGAVFGLLNGILITVFNMNAFVTTLATQMVFKGACYLVCNNAAVGGLSDDFKYFGQGYIGIIPVPVIIMLLLAVVVAVLLYRTEFGRHVIAIGGNEQAARASGVEIDKTRRWVYVFMGVCVALGAIITTGRLGSAQQTAGQGMEMDAIAAVVLGGTTLAGGKGNVLGTILGCFTVGVINNGLNLAHVDTNWQIVAKGLLIIMAVMIDSQTEKVMSKLKNRSRTFES